ncbi:MAG: ABC transporter substrate-binding protein [Arthrobacter sp.]|uniref:ABC transporter substrate-binding protein n=1 Tax=Arthrobacter sp. TaxID=1667 RepID=UPI0034792D24
MTNTLRTTDRRRPAPARGARRGLATLAALTLLGGLAACGSGSPSGAAGAEPATDPDAGPLTAVTVGAIPIGDVAPVHLGKAKGFFEEEGLDLTIEDTTGGAVAVPGVVAGSYDFAFGNLVSLMVARDKGLDVRYVSNGASTTGEAGTDFAAVVVPEDSPITDPADLEGKTVTSNNLANIGDTAIRATVDREGGDGSQLTFVEMAFPDAFGALESGQVDAALILEPFLTPALDQGGRAVLWPYAGTHERLDIGGYFSTGERIDQEPETAAAFAAAMERSLAYAQEHPDEVRETIGTYTKTDPELLERIRLPRFAPEFSRDAAAELGRAAVRYGTLADEPDLDALLPAE